MLPAHSMREISTTNRSSVVISLLSYITKSFECAVHLIELNILPQICQIAILTGLEISK